MRFDFGWIICDGIYHTNEKKNRKKFLIPKIIEKSGAINRNFPE